MVRLLGFHNNMILVDGIKVKTPSSFTWGLQDISGSDSGRTQDTVMHKNRIGQKRKIDLVWAMPTLEEAHVILTAFHPEYVKVTYEDPLEGKRVTKSFYAEDMSAPVKTWSVGNKRYESISLSIIER